MLIDPAVRKTIALTDLHADADYSIWEGFACQGYPVTTILRGKVIVEHGKLVGSSSDGRWVSAGSRATFWAARGVNHGGEPSSFYVQIASPLGGFESIPGYS